MDFNESFLYSRVYDSRRGKKGTKLLFCLQVEPKRGERTVWNWVRNRRRRMDDHVKVFLHREDVSTVINGETGEGQEGRGGFTGRGSSRIKWKISTRNSSERERTLSAWRSPSVFNPSGLWNQETEKHVCKIHENFSSKVLKKTAHRGETSWIVW